MQDESDHLPLRVRSLTLRADADTGAPRIATATAARPAGRHSGAWIVQCVRAGCSMIVTRNTLTSGIFRSRNAREALGEAMAESFSETCPRPELCQPIMRGKREAAFRSFRTSTRTRARNSPNIGSCQTREVRVN